MTDEQRAIAATLQRRALDLQNQSEDGLSVCDAVELAAIQLGMTQAL
jgi:hypothetical protein